MRSRRGTDGCSRGFRSARARTDSASGRSRAGTRSATQASSAELAAPVIVPRMRGAVLVAIVLVLAPAAAASTPFRATEFVTRVDNPWFPLTPGTVYVYRGIKDGSPSRDVVTVTHATRTSEGVKATSVHDDLYVEGRLEQRTTDWYAQDRGGNVWYLGEATAELDRTGHVTNREGSWLAGVGGARP